MKSIYDINDNEKILLNEIIPDELDHCISYNSFDNTYIKYKQYIPKLGDTFYYACWWLGSAVCDTQIDLHLCFRIHETFWEDDEHIYEKDIFHKSEIEQYNTNFIETLDNGNYFVNEPINTCINTRLYLNNTEDIVKADKQLNFKTYKNNCIFGKTFQDLQNNIKIFKEPFNFMISNKLELMFYKRLQKINELAK